MYLKLGNLNLNYTSFGQNDFTIVAQVCNSKMSYEKPVLVRDSDELMCWFGYDFDEISYFNELLSKGVTLFLTCPVSSKVNRNQSGFVDYTNWEKIGSSIVDNSEVYREGLVYVIDGKEFVYDGISLVEKSEPNYPVSNGFIQLPDKGVEGKIYTKIDHSYWIWLNDLSDWVDIDELPQNLNDFESDSINNRDTLILYNDWTYSTPEFVNSVSKDQKCSLVGLDYRKLIEGYQTLAFIIKFGSKLPKEGNYLILPNKEKENTLIYFGKLPTEVNPKYYPGGAVEISINDWWAEELRSVLSNLGYVVSSDRLYCPSPTEVTYFYEMPDEFSLKESLLLTQDLLENNIDRPVLTKFWSKTIGNGGPGGNIFITFSPGGIIEISRYNYTETYLEEDRVDLVSKINNESKLVYCEGEIQFPEEVRTIALRGSSPLSNQNVECTRKSLEILVNEGEIKPDFILINSLADYGIDSSKCDYWNTLLKYSNVCDCQFLIQNTEEDYKLNYTEDKQNRLIYFYGKMLIELIPRPGYYVFLESLLTNKFSIPTSKILYNSPVTDSNKEISEGGLTIYEEDLKTNKSNYLIDNGLSYFYKYLQDGENPETSIVMRFVLSKITRQIHKNLWGLISERGYNEANTVLVGLLESIINSYSFIKNIRVKDFDTSGETLKISLETTISDLVKSHVSLDIEINYNKLNN